MAVVSLSLALLGGVIGAGFASGREIVCFFARHGASAGIAVACALLSLSLLFLRLPALLKRPLSTSMQSISATPSASNAAPTPSSAAHSASERDARPASLNSTIMT